MEIERMWDKTAQDWYQRIQGDVSAACLQQKRRRKVEILRADLGARLARGKDRIASSAGRVGEVYFPLVAVDSRVNASENTQHIEQGDILSAVMIGDSHNVGSLRRVNRSEERRVGKEW